jgi:transposase
LREWSYEEATQVFPRSHRARRAPETLRRWVRQQERDTGQRPGPTTAEEERIKALEREVRELRKANEILRLASAFFAQAELGRHFKP